MTPMRLAFGTNAFTRHPLEEGLAAIAAAGYRWVEILADRPHLFPPDWDRERLAGLARTLHRLGLGVCSLNANTAVGFYQDPPPEPLFGPGLCNPDPALRDLRVCYTRRCLEIAADLGAACVTLTSGRPLPGCPPEEAIGHLRASLARLLPDAEALGVRLALEYEPGLLVEDAGQAVALFDQLASPWLGLNLDVGHARVVGEEPAALIRQLGTARLFHLHLEDIRDRVHYHRIPGEGEMDFGAIFAALGEIGYAGAAAVELYTCVEAPAAAARQSRDHLARWLG
jgi:sugar phosphate isomerase/epimerase